MKKPRALVVDDEPDIRELLSITLERMNLDVTAADTIAAATRELRANPFDLCLTDMRLPDGDGLSLVEWIQTHKPHTPVAVITAHGNVETAVRALKLGAFDFISKPLDVAALRKLIIATLKLGENIESTMQLPQVKLLGGSRAMEQLREMIERVARSQAPVHIYGESGTGKELVAHLIHEAGPRREGPFVPVNCGAIPTELMESELFGHRKGSFTGAVADKQGLIQSAEGGTLFLDEIADLPLHMQVKLLRVIQEKTIRPVGESRELPIDVRILSATHKNLATQVAEGKFREDLFYRVNVIEIRVPPLRERLEDIDELVDSIVTRLGRQIGNRSLRITEAASKALREYHFPGNVRELENVLERAATLCVNGVIDAGDLQLRPKVAANEVPIPNSVAPGERLGDALEDIERDAIVRALEQTRYNKTKAAQLLGMTFRSLRYRIKKLGIE
ncbi:type 4 fimbriae expression regulatory protein PilR [Steroidobacter agaridevorans]|uniref:Type 4 fimbriae expression regulatory protein PilR n=1 Tax=Steroidobacter agaridevorans TaxID=2695856 RepID=A0A829Y7Q7_9GAMM|nr:sigma-54 dependent transcriptional regulator [Steroidobacter agaridevorans]GFE79073.1 type 4 fimbriae expression regulatory protein PilR [Steroidobacter agaridevorans]GFE88229.1 type 4 fimbriae expression regulatory protein PilR [Steroidobacter agaridevorans]